MHKIISIFPGLRGELTFSSGQNWSEAVVSPVSECALKGFLGWVALVGFFILFPPPQFSMKFHIKNQGQYF